MKFNYREFLDDEVFKRLNEIKAFAPETVEAEAAMRKSRAIRTTGWCSLPPTTTRG